MSDGRFPQWQNFPWVYVYRKNFGSYLFFSYIVPRENKI